MSALVEIVGILGIPTGHEGLAGLGLIPALTPIREFDVLADLRRERQRKRLDRLSALPRARQEKREAAAVVARFTVRLDGLLIRRGVDDDGVLPLGAVRLRVAC